MFKASVTDFIKKLLLTNEDAKDNYVKVVVYVWCYELGLRDFSGKKVMFDFMRNVTFLDFVLKLLSGSLSKPESIRRTWQKLLEEFPQLRGKGYEKRHKKQEVVKQQVGQQGLFN